MTVRQIGTAVFVVAMAVLVILILRQWFLEYHSTDNRKRKVESDSGDEVPSMDVYVYDSNGKVLEHFNGDVTEIEIYEDGLCFIDADGFPHMMFTKTGTIVATPY